MSSPDASNEVAGRQSVDQNPVEAQEDPGSSDATASGSAGDHAGAEAVVQAHSSAGAKQQAVQVLVNIGVELELATRALEGTEAHSGNFERWLDEAQVWLTTMADADQDMQNLREAMQVSLEDAAAQREPQLPMKEWPLDKLQETFHDTSLMRALCSCKCEALLHESELKPLLVELLNLEHRCTCKWYRGPGTTRWFCRMADDCLPLLQGITCTPSDHPAAAAAASAPPAAAAAADSAQCAPSSAATEEQQQQQCSTTGRRSKRARTGPGTGAQRGRAVAAAPAAVPGDPVPSTDTAGARASLQALLQERLQLLQQEVLVCMQPDGGAPLIFRTSCVPAAAAGQQNGGPDGLDGDGDVELVAEHACAKSHAPAIAVEDA